MIKVILEELRYCERGSYQHGYLVDSDSMEFVENEGFKGGSFETKEEAIEFAKSAYKNLYGLDRRLCRLAVVEFTPPKEDWDDPEDYKELWSSEELPLEY